MNLPELCVTCRYFRQGETDEGDPAGEGTCHAEPPYPNLDDEGIAVWPWVEATDFCGSWRPVKLSRLTRLRVAMDSLSRPKPKAKVLR
jgi:hypothetical protein